jgi:hypothetical protein
VNVQKLPNRQQSNLAFQFESPSTSTPPIQHAHLSSQYGNGYLQQNGHPPAFGMGHMLERMHNVSNRESLPQKRRKIQQDGNENREVKSHFNGGGKGGVLGEYMKEKKEEGRKEAAANETRPSVDLTGGE